MSTEAKKHTHDDVGKPWVAVNSRDATEHQWAQEQLRAQRDLALALSGASVLDDGLRLCLEAALRVSGMDCGGIYLVDEASGALNLAFHQGLMLDFVDSAAHYEADSASARLVMAGKPIYTEHLRLGVPLDEARRREGLRAVAVVPLHHEDRVIGCLNVASHTLDQVPASARDTLETVATQVANAIARLRVEEKLREQQAFLDSIVQNVAEGIAVEDADGVFTFVNPAAAALVGYSPEELVGQPRTLVVPPDQQPVVQAAQLRRRQAETDRYELELVRKDGTRFPVLMSGSPRFDAQGRFAGTLAVFTDMSRRVQIEKELQRRTAQMVGLREVGLEIAAQLDLDLLLRSIAERAVALLGGVGGGLDLYRPDLDALEWTAVVSPCENVPGALLRRGEGLDGKVWEAGKPLLVEDYQRWEGRAPMFEGIPFAAMVGAPIRWGEEFLGVLNVQAKEPGAFSPSDAELLSLFAAQAAIAIHNARMFESERAGRQRLEMLYRIGQTLTSTLDPDTILDRLTDEALRATGATHGSVLVTHPDEGCFERRSLRGFNPEQVEEARARPLSLGCGLNGRAYRTSQIVRVEDVQADADYFPLLPETRAELVVPICHGDRVIGNLDLQSPEVGAFHKSETDLDFLQALTDQVALALENARLFQAERAARQRAQTLHAASLALSASLDLQQVFGLILSELRHVVPYDSASVQQLKGNRLEIIGGHGFPNLGELLGVGFDLADDDNPNWEVVHARAPLILDDAPAAYAGFRCEPHAQAGVRSWLGVPLLFGDRVIGIITLDRQVPGFYSEEHARLAMAFAAQAAIAIENARLYQEVQQRLRELTLLFETSAALSASLDVDTVLRAMAQRITSALAAERCTISLWELEWDAVVTLLDYSRDPERWQPEPQGTVYYLADYPATRQALSTRQPFIVQIGDPRADPAELAWMAADGVRSLLMVPLVVGDRAIGLLEVVESGQERVFAPGEAALCQTLANQAAAALENARLYDEARRRNRELALLNRVIAASAASQEAKVILEVACHELARALDLPSAVAVLLNERKTEAVVMAEHRPEDPPSLRDLAIPLPDELQVLYSAHTMPLVVDNVQTDPRLASVRSLLHQRGTVSMLSLPLLIEGEVAGSLLFETAERRPFSAGEVDLAQRVAEQVSGALARTRLQETQRRLSTAMEQTAESIIITDAEGIILYVNPAFERVTGYSRAEAIGQNPRLLKSGKQGAPFYADLWRTITAGQVWRGRIVNRKKDRGLFTEEATIAPVRNQAGEIVNYVATMRDVTREVALEEQFRQAQKMEAVGRLAGGVAHDFNNLLTVIHLSVRLLERKMSPENPLWQHVQRISETGERATRLTKQLLAFSRQEVIEPHVLNLNSVVGDMSKMLRRIIGEDIELVTDLVEEPWPVSADPTQVDQVVLNLAVNARDAMPQGGTLTIKTANVVLDEAYARQHLDVEPGAHVMLEISDTGMGMEGEVKQHLFEPFFTTKERGKGTGLGLAMVFGIIRQNKGHVEVDSEIGQGTSFRIYLPRTEKTEARLLPSSPPLHPSRSDRNGETLLVVEDEADVRTLTVEILTMQGYRVLATANGPEALRISAEHDGPIHLLLTDLVMPHMSGKELAEQISSRRPNTRVLYMSGYADSAVLQGRTPAMEGAFLSKPFTAEHLLHGVRAALGGNNNGTQDSYRG
jgi:PAS domain S-box-containing protein